MSTIDARDLEQLSHRNESNSGRMLAALKVQQLEIEQYVALVKARDAEVAGLKAAVSKLSNGKLESQIERLKAQLADANARLASSKAGEAAVKAQLAEASHQISALRETQSKMDAEYASAVAQTASGPRFTSIETATVAIDRAEATVRVLRDQLAAARVKEAQITRERDHLLAFKTVAVSDAAGHASSTEDLRAKLTAAEKALEESQREVAGLRDAVSRSVKHQLEIDRQLTNVLGKEFATQFTAVVRSPPDAAAVAAAEKKALSPPPDAGAVLANFFTSIGDLFGAGNAAATAAAAADEEDDDEEEEGDDEEEEAAAVPAAAAAAPLSASRGRSAISPVAARKKAASPPPVAGGAGGAFAAPAAKQHGASPTAPDARLASAFPADSDVASKNRIEAAAAARRAERAVSERDDPFAVVNHELRATPLLRDLLDPSRFVRVSATTFAPLSMLQHRIFIILAMGIELPEGEDEDEAELDDEAMNGRLDLSMQADDAVDALKSVGVWEALVRAAAPPLHHHDSGATRADAQRHELARSGAGSAAAGTARSHRSGPQQSSLGILTSSDWAAALRAAHPGPVQRGQAILSLVGALEADISDLIISKDSYAGGYQFLVSGTGSGSPGPAVFAEAVQQALYRWIASEACSLPPEEVPAAGDIALGRSVVKGDDEHGPLTLELIKEWSPAVWGVLCGYHEFAVTEPRDKLVTLAVWQAFFAKHHRQHSSLEHFHLLHSLKLMASCPDSFLREALALDATSSAGDCSVM